ncbi:hypothetical protein FFY28_00945 [Staphylococcus aureus]|nr:hypothetical protein FFY30_01015 [Staphylococcus aureus]TLV20743.1 hypothetical protein FFY28_00945 [Staphylococcus aureus]TLV32691.1 hypothetical protein FFY27_03620 [Staphylococcus aureus]TLV35163.1 hypothetical protein FFY26_04745 [Staphylococcus aureus]TLV41521.1 hypothetical protein FFY22_03900 [Staphylococcus aureus]
MLGPRQLAHYCKLTFRQLLCWGPKSLLQAHFRSVNYCQYNFVEHITLIYIVPFIYSFQILSP